MNRLPQEEQTCFLAVLEATLDEKVVMRCDWGVGGGGDAVAVGAAVVGFVVAAVVVVVVGG